MRFDADCARMRLRMEKKFSKHLKLPVDIAKLRSMVSRSNLNCKATAIGHKHLN